jgi:hypothetical protein
VVSTPACSSRIAAVWRRTCGVIVLAVSDGQRSAAWVACLAIRRASALRVSGVPVLVGNSGSTGGLPRSASHARRTAAVSLVSGVIRCLRPLPVVVACAPVPRWMSPQRRPVSSEAHESGLGEQDDDRVVAATGPTRAVWGVDEGVELGLGEVGDQRAFVALGPDLQDPLDRGGVFWMAHQAVAVEGADRGQARVAGSGAAAAVGLEVVQERAAQRRI